MAEDRDIAFLDFVGEAGLADAHHLDGAACRVERFISYDPDVFFRIDCHLLHVSKSPIERLFFSFYTRIIVLAGVGPAYVQKEKKHT